METEELRTRIGRSHRVVGFTGAGISTDSGIADYRGTGGVWTRYRVVTIREFLADDEARTEYWRRKADMWEAVRDARPNPGHLAFAAFHRRGLLAGLITQNVDGLHRKSGIPADRIVELHGNTLQSACLECGHVVDTEEAVGAFRKTGEPPRCADCGGWMKPATVSFGQSMPAGEMERAARLCREAEIVIAAGSSLAVQPAAGFPLAAKQGGALLVIVNRNETALDEFADVLLRGEAGEILPRLC